MRLSLLLFALCGVTTLALAVETVKVPVDNDQVKVLSVVVQPHEKTKLHQHKINRVMIYMQAGSQDFDYQGKGKSSLTWKAGEVKWSPAAGMHIAEITGANPVNIVEIELKKPGPGTLASSALDPVKVAPRNYKMEMDNGQVRVIRVKIGPHGKIPMHEHTVDRVVTYITDASTRVTSADGKVDTVEHKAGDVIWGTPAKHAEENLSDKPFEAVVVEVKK